MKERKRRVVVVLLVLVATLAVGAYQSWTRPPEPESPVLGTTSQLSGELTGTPKATEALETLPVKGRAPKTGYKRSLFGEGWANGPSCDVRNVILKRDLTNITTRSETDCTVLTGSLLDPYTGKTIQFLRGETTSDDIQIDHVVALSDAWQKGAQQLAPEKRVQFANDGLNLLAVEGEINSQKSDSDAASWLPPNKPYRCMYVARQIAVKQKYALWVTDAEKAAMKRVLSDCPDQRLPVEIMPGSVR